MLDYTPMPGENPESAEAREKEAIKNGENFNPNLTDEAAAGFENLSNEVSFAGDDSERYDSDNAVAAKFNEQWNQGIAPDLDDVQTSVEYDYISGATEQAATNPDALADYAYVNKNINESEDAEAQPFNNQPHDISEVAAVQAVSAAALSEKLVDDIKKGDEDAISRIEEVKEQANNALDAADKINAASLENSNNAIEANMAASVASQVQEKAREAIDTVEQAKAEYDSMSEEEKEAAKKDEDESVEANTTEEEKESIDLSHGIFS